MTARTFRYALIVEGWPEIFVTDPSLTLSSIADGRTVVSGLAHPGRFSERIIPLEGKIQASGMTFKIVPTGNTRISDVSSTDPATAALSTYPDRLCSLTADWAYDDTAEPTVLGPALTDNTVYHVGTEAIRFQSGGPVERNIWDTQEQSHYTDSWFYDRPPSMEGRRCFVTRYENDTAVTGYGASIAWRGVVSGQPTLDRDCVTWSIKTQPVTHLLKQTIGGGFGEAKPMGLYFSYRSAFYGRVWVGKNPQSPSATSLDFKVTGIFTEQSLVDAVNVELENLRTSTGADANFSWIRLIRAGDGWAIVTSRSTAAGTIANSIGFMGGSFLTGFANTVGGRTPDQWVYADGSTAGASSAMEGPGEYTLTFTPHDMPWGQYEYSGGAGSVLGLAPTRGMTLDSFTDAAESTNWPSDRVYLNADLSGAGAVSFEDVYDDGAVFAGVPNRHIYNVSGSGDDATPDGITINYITVDGISFGSPFIMAANGDSKCTVVRSYSMRGSVIDFVNGLIALSVEANRGDTPFLTDDDFATPLSLADFGLGPDILERQYAFTKQVTVEDVLARELQLASHMMRLAADGRIEFVPIAVPTYGTAEYTFDHSNIITPPDGEWPTSEPQRDGIVTSVTVQQQYDAIENKWTDPPIVVEDGDAVSTHKNRGRGKVEIKTYSTPVNPPDYAFISKLAERFLGFASREYVIVTIRVTHDYRDVLCGMNVELTHRSIPDGNGRRGVIEVPGVVIERAWDLDPASKSMGDLVIWTAAKSLGGYCPSGLVTGQTDNTGNNWTLTFDPTNPVNEAISVAHSTDEGAITRSFAAGDNVVITQINDATPTTVAGTIASITGDTITIQFAGAWTPGSDAWVLMYADDSTAVGDQLRQVFVADGSFATAAGLRFFV